jgi:nickel/cobalt exporter
VKSFRIASTALIVGLFGRAPGRVYAHLVNTDVGEFYAGMLHPLTSAEHLLPIVALAILASQCGRRAARWVLVLVPLALMTGIVVGNRVTSVDLVHFMNLAALVALGGLLITPPRKALSIVAAAAVLLGLILGYRSGVDMANAAVGYRFIPGVGFTGFMVVALLAAWVPEAASPTIRTLRALVGGGFAVAGVAMLFGARSVANIPAVRGVGLPSQEYLVAMVTAPELSVLVVVGALLAAVMWGAGHALTPGHSKTLVAAYLVGSRSTPWHACYLGLTVTLTHTIGVFALGLLTLVAAQSMPVEQLYPWLATLSGVIVLSLGLSMLVSRIRTWGCRGGYRHTHDDDHHHDGHEHPHHPHPHPDHDHHHHEHSHLPLGADGAPVTWRSVLGLGISGGLLPCPSALVLLVAAVSLDRAGFGLVLVLAFSLGLAGVLTAVGLLFVKGQRLFSLSPRFVAASYFLPVLSALIICTIGLGLTIEAVAKLVS